MGLMDDDDARIVDHQIQRPFFFCLASQLVIFNANGLSFGAHKSHYDLSN